MFRRFLSRQEEPVELPKEHRKALREYSEEIIVELETHAADGLESLKASIQQRLSESPDDDFQEIRKKFAADMIASAERTSRQITEAGAAQIRRIVDK